jgi:hypothetical protein
MNPRTIDLVVALVPVGALVLFVLWRVIVNIERITGDDWAPGTWRLRHTPWRHGHPAVRRTDEPPG